VIGISYAVASAATILAMSHATSESEHLKDMLVGNILAVSWLEVGKTAALYAVIGVFHYVFRRQFLAISIDHDKAEREGMRTRLWDFLFYASFGFVVTSSVLIAGVLLVFCYLIVPSVAAMLYAERIGPRLAIGGRWHGRLGPRHLSLGQAGPADGRGDGLHVRHRAGADGGGEAAAAARAGARLKRAGAGGSETGCGTVRAVTPARDGRAVAVALWLAALLLMAGAAVWQRLTGPTHPRRVTVSLEGHDVRLRLRRSATTGEPFSSASPHRRE